jgi:hypothetical protein
VLYNKRMQLSARGFWSARALDRRPVALRTLVDGFASGRRAVYGRRTTGGS